ncbi:TrmB family transcriptional regulator [Candidatus Woesearchaeota archaeon]|nr:TrmB family transcriptional regulator [Candidatus Woesearchaeota archaeon]
MIVKEEFLNKLRQFFGLNLYEVRIWTALLSRGVSTAGELSDIGNVPRSRSYDVLESLEKKGFVMMKLGKPIKYVAVEPKEVVERVKKLVAEDAKERQKKLDDLRNNDVLKELNLLHKQGIEFVEPSDLSGAIRGRHNLYSHLEYMIKNAEKNITIMTSSKGLIRKLEALKPELEKLNKKGVKIRIAAPITKESASAVKELSKIAEIKHSDKLNARFCIVDSEDVMFMAMDDDSVHPSYDIGIWANTPYFASALESLFNTSWKDMEDGTKVVD